jgi:hypothetical protein
MGPVLVARRGQAHRVGADYARAGGSDRRTREGAGTRHRAGVDSWSPAHDSSLFGLNPAGAWSYLLNKAAFWRHERWSVDVRDGMDDIALAFVADAWSRSGRVSVDAAASGSRDAPQRLGASGAACCPRQTAPTAQPTAKNFALKDSLKSDVCLMASENRAIVGEDVL